MGTSIEAHWEVTRHRDLPTTLAEPTHVARTLFYNTHDTFASEDQLARGFSCTLAVGGGRPTARSVRDPRRAVRLRLGRRGRYKSVCPVALRYLDSSGRCRVMIGVGETEFRSLRRTCQPDLNGLASASKLNGRRLTSG
jgi:hypothetical protein